MMTPGFMAEASMYVTKQHYRGRSGSGSRNGPPVALGIQPALRRIGPLSATCTSTDGKNTCVCAGRCFADEDSCQCEPIKPRLWMR